MNRFQAGLFTVLAVMALAGCSTKPTTVTPPPGSAGADATPIATGSATGDLGLWPMGARVTLGSPAVGQVVVNKFEKNPPCKDTKANSGDFLLGVSVEYYATQTLPYAMADWTAKDETGPLTPTTGCYKDILVPGSASAGEKLGGWFLLQMPSSAQHLWVMYTSSSGSKISWQLY